MSIQDTIEFDKEGEPVRFPLLRRFFLTLVIILVAVLSFGIGRLSGQSGGASGVKIDYEKIPGDSAPATAQNAASQAPPTPTTNTASVYASSKGTKYYYQNCKSSVSAANKVTFASAGEAERAGYTLAANCKPN